MVMGFAVGPLDRKEPVGVAHNKGLCYAKDSSLYGNTLRVYLYAVRNAAQARKGVYGLCVQVCQRIQRMDCGKKLRNFGCHTVLKYGIACYKKKYQVSMEKEEK